MGVVARSAFAPIAVTRDAWQFKRMSDELAIAITKIIWPILKSEGFHRIRRKLLIRTQSRIVQRLDFQVSRWGGKNFCVNVSANLIASNEHVTLSPGFRLTRDTDGGDLWLPSRTKAEAETSATAILGSIRAEALPFFEATETIEGFSAVLSKEKWGALHHLSFQRGVAAALMGIIPDARKHLTDAIRLYEEDGREWCPKYIEKAKQLLEALAAGTASQLLDRWEQANRKAHGIG
jgi:hypothetical protein